MPRTASNQLGASSTPQFLHQWASSFWKHILYRGHHWATRESQKGSEGIMALKQHTITRDHGPDSRPTNSNHHNHRRSVVVDVAARNAAEVVRPQRATCVAGTPSSRACYRLLIRGSLPDIRSEHLLKETSYLFFL